MTKSSVIIVFLVLFTITGTESSNALKRCKQDFESINCKPGSCNFFCNESFGFTQCRKYAKVLPFANVFTTIYTYLIHLSTTIKKNVERSYRSISIFLMYIIVDLELTKLCRK